MSKKIRIEWEDGSFGSRATGIMVDRKKRVLLSRLEDEDVWVLPGGTISWYETSQETVKREFLEETGFEIEVHRLLWIIENFFVFNDEKCHDIGLYFLVSVKEAKEFWEQEEFIGQEERHTSDRSWKLIFKWFDPSELDKLNLKPAVLIELLKNIPEHPVHIIHHAQRLHAYLQGLIVAIEIKEIGVESLPCYAEIPISFKVESIFQVETINPAHSCSW